MIEVSPIKRTLKICHTNYFLNLPKTRFCFFIDNLCVTYVYMCFVDEQENLLIPKLNNINSNLEICCPKAKSTNIDSLIKEQLELFYNSEFTSDYEQPQKYYEYWQQLTKQNKYPKFEVITNCSKIKFDLNPSLDLQLEAVRQNGKAIQFIKNPSLEVQLEAGNDANLYKNPSSEIILH